MIKLSLNCIEGIYYALHSTITKGNSPNEKVLNSLIQTVDGTKPDSRVLLNDEEKIELLKHIDERIAYHTKRRSVYFSHEAKVQMDVHTLALREYLECIRSISDENMIQFCKDSLSYVQHDGEKFVLQRRLAI